MRPAAARPLSHGLWPQYEEGWPEDCRTPARDPTRRDAPAKWPISWAQAGLRYQWKKHGRCTGLSSADYFALTRKARGLGSPFPQRWRTCPATYRCRQKVVEDAFIEANPELSRDGVTVTCRDRALQEVRICLTPTCSPGPARPIHGAIAAAVSDAGAALMAAAGASGGDI